MAHELQPIVLPGDLSNENLYSMLSYIDQEAGYADGLIAFRMRSFASIVLAQRGYKPVFDTLGDWVKNPKLGIGQYAYNYLTDGPTAPWEIQYTFDATVEDVLELSIDILALARYQPAKAEIQKLIHEQHNLSPNFSSKIIAAMDEIDKPEPASNDQWTELVRKYIGPTDESHEYSEAYKAHGQFMRVRELLLNPSDNKQDRINWQITEGRHLTFSKTEATVIRVYRDTGPTSYSGDTRDIDDDELSSFPSDFWPEVVAKLKPGNTVEGVRSNIQRTYTYSLFEDGFGKVESESWDKSRYVDVKLKVELSADANAICIQVYIRSDEKSDWEKYMSEIGTYQLTRQSLPKRRTLLQYVKDTLQK
jgi:hypothetical protein